MTSGSTSGQCCYSDAEIVSALQVSTSHTGEH